MKKNILFVYYRIDEQGGIINAISNLSSALNKDYNVTILCLIKSTEKFYEIHPDVKIITAHTATHSVIKFSDFLRNFLHFLPKIHAITDYIGHLGIYFKLNEWFKENGSNYDTIISCWYKLTDILGQIKSINKKVLSWEHIDYRSGGFIWKSIQKSSYRKIKGISYLVNNATDFYSKFNKNCHVIPNLVNINIENIVCTQKKKEILTISWLRDRKNVKDLIIAFYQSSLYKNNWILKIIGEGDLENILKNQVKKLGLEDHVIFTGRLNTPDIIKHLKTASIFGMTSKREGLPIVLIEAQFAGLALIAYDCPTGPSEIITKENGFLIPLHDINSFGEKLKVLGNNSDLLKEKQQGSLKTAQRYSTENIVRLWKQIL